MLSRIRVAATMKRDDVLAIVTGTQGETSAALNRLADRSHPKMELTAGDNVIFSARVIPGKSTVLHVKAFAGSASKFDHRNDPL
ncbi:MAG: hypothetical protein R3A47_11525 [Polyangiales bacterium]